MNKEKHTKQAQRKVNKALDVFNKATVEVEKAQSTLSAGIDMHNAEINRLRDTITTLESEIKSHESSKQVKIDTMGENNELLAKLAQFTPSK